MGRIYELTSEKILQTDFFWQTSDEKDGAYPKSAQYRDSLNPESVNKIPPFEGGRRRFLIIKLPYLSLHKGGEHLLYFPKLKPHENTKSE